MPRHLAFLAFLAGASLAVSAGAVELKSPDGNVVVAFELKSYRAAQSCPVYRVSYRGRAVLLDSRLGLELAEGSLGGDLRVVKQTTTGQHDATWKPICAERESIRDHYNELVLDLETIAAPPRTLRLVFRAYDEGIAFRYELPEQPNLKTFTIETENTSFNFGGDYTTWAVYHAQGNYDGAEAPLSRVKPGVERPLTVQIADDLYASVTEARCVDYARMKLRPSRSLLPEGTDQDRKVGKSRSPESPARGQPEKSLSARGTYALEAFLDAERGKYGNVTGTTPFVSPWRVVMVADSPGRLMEHDCLIMNLNEPCALADTSWIKPGKVIRETTLTTAGGKECIDFSVARGLQYVEFDAGWYGPEMDAKSDARRSHPVSKNPAEPKSLDVEDVVRYGNTKGVGVILYVNQRALERQLDELLPLYEKWGVKGIKFGFVNVGSQHWTQWLHEGIRKAAVHHLMVDIHDEFRNTGYQRTYPNLMTVEGIGGNEEFPTPVHNATLPFTRFLTGPADYTFCWYSNKLKPTHAHQLAISTIFFSPWQFLYWYDKPSNYRGEPALDYWKQLPTTWDETRVVSGAIGRHVCVARRKGREWFVGAICPDGWPLDIPLDFLAQGEKYRATIYSDANPDRPESKDVKIETLAVDSRTVLHEKLSPYGGVVLRIVPEEKSAQLALRDEYVATSAAKPFVHPGLLHTKADLERMRAKVAAGAEPWKSDFEMLAKQPESQANWRLRGPFELVTRDRRRSEHIDAFDSDGNAAYQNALMWCITGDEAHARKAVEILNAWSAKLRTIGGADRKLAASLGSFKYVNAAEIMRYAYPAWRADDIRRCEAMLRNVIYPVLKDFATFANGNWDTGCIKTMMAVGVFCDDRAIFDRGVDYFYRGAGNGRLTHYIVNDAGQCQESGRDQSHAQLGLAHLAEACEIGWNQGLDMYGAENNRLLRGFEYTAKYNLGQDVPFVSYRDTTGKYFAKTIATSLRGRLRPIYEMVYNHYANRRGISAPFTRQAAENLRPEGAAHGADHPGFGTLLFSQR